MRILVGGVGVGGGGAWWFGGVAVVVLVARVELRRWRSRIGGRRAAVVSIDIHGLVADLLRVRDIGDRLLLGRDVHGGGDGRWCAGAGAGVDSSQLGWARAGE